MEIGIIGAGIIGRTLGEQLGNAGHTIVFGSRNPSDSQYDDLRSRSSVVLIQDVAKAADVLLIAIPGSRVVSLLETEGEALNGRLIIDATNDTGSGTFHHLDAYERLAPQARVFRAFNTLGWENFADPKFGSQQADLFYSGPEGSDSEVVEGIITNVGLRPVYVGAGAGGAGLLDGVTRLWFALQGEHGRHLAFRVLGTLE